MSAPESREDVLTIADVAGDLPNGTATVYRVSVEEGRQVRLATLDEHGVLRTLDADRATIPVEEIVGLEPVRER